MARLSEFHFTPRNLQNAISGGGCMAYETSWPWPGVDPWMWAGWCPVSCGGFSSIPHSASSPCSNLTSFRAWRLSLLSKPCLFGGVLWILLKFWLWFPFGTVQASVHWPTATEPPPPCCGDTYARSLARPSAPFYVTPLGTSENFWVLSELQGNRQLGQRVSG